VGIAIEAVFSQYTLLMWFGKRQKRAYFDHASATALCAQAASAMHKAEHLVGNPGAIHAEGVEAMRVLKESREKIALHLGVKAREIIFTSGLTESDNLAILGYARALERVRRTLVGTRWIVSAIEHDSVLESFGEIERLGGTVVHISPDERGLFSPEQISRELTEDTVFVSIGWANNEIGVMQPLSKIVRVIRAYEKEHGTTIAVHTDAGQAPLYVPTVLHSLDVDLVSMSAAKLYGPHGVGLLYVNPRISIAKITFGGHQERSLRAGTENVALAAGFAAAFDAFVSKRDDEAKRLKTLRDTLADLLQKSIPGLVVNGDLSRALPHLLNVSIPDISSEYVVLALDHEGFAVSTKSACREGEEKLSHVVAAITPERWRARNTLRFSLGEDSQKYDIERLSETLSHIISQGAGASAS